MPSRLSTLCLLALGVCCAAAPAAAQGGAPPPAASETAAQIMGRTLERTNWKDMQGRARLSILGGGGEARPERALRLWSRKTEAGESQMVMLFDEPADFRGSGFLMLEHKERDDDRWLYSKGMRRLTRIQGAGKAGNFLSSDFTYYDIGRPKLSEWVWERLPDQTLAGEPCYVLQARPASPQVAEDTGYQKVIWWVERRREISLKAEYFDKRLLADPAAKPCKTLEVKAVTELEGLPFATEMAVRDHESGRVSTLRFEDLKVDQGLAADFFSQRTLLRGR